MPPVSSRRDPGKRSGLSLARQLPEDWRDVIDRMVSKDRHLTSPNTAIDREGSSNDNDCDCETEGEQQSPVSTVSVSPTAVKCN